MTTKPGDVAGARATMYARQLTIGAARQRVFDAIATLDGPRHWWTTGLTGRRERFGLAEPGPQGCELPFRHIGISPQVVGAGWDHFLASLAAYAQHGDGSPYGA